MGSSPTEIAILIVVMISPNETLLELLQAARPFVQAGLYLSEHGSKTQADIFQAVHLLQKMDAVLTPAHEAPSQESSLG